MTMNHKRILSATLLALAVFGDAWAHTNKNIPPHVNENVAVRCHLEAGCEINAVAWLTKTTYCEIENLEGDDCKCPGRVGGVFGGTCAVAESTITQDYREWREISVGDFQFNPRLRVDEIEVQTDGQLFGVYTDLAFRNARWANYSCWEDADADETKYELEDCDAGQARAVTDWGVE